MFVHKTMLHIVICDHWSHSISAVATWVDFPHLQRPFLLLPCYTEPHHWWKWQIKRKSCWETILVQWGQAICDPWLASRQPQSLWRCPWCRPLPPPHLFLDLKCAIQSYAYSDLERNLTWFGTQKKSLWNWALSRNFSEHLFHFPERFRGWPTFTAPAHVCEPINWCLFRFFDVPALAAFAEANLQSSLSFLLPLDPASHASAALPSPYKPLMRPILPFYLFLSFF